MYSSTGSNQAKWGFFYFWRNGRISILIKNLVILVHEALAVVVKTSSSTLVYLLRLWDTSSGYQKHLHFKGYPAFLLDYVVTISVGSYGSKINYKHELQNNSEDAETQGIAVDWAKAHSEQLFCFSDFEKCRKRPKKAKTGSELFKVRFFQRKQPHFKALRVRWMIPYESPHMGVSRTIALGAHSPFSGENITIPQSENSKISTFA